jgi:hypothetical protein
MPSVTYADHDRRAMTDDDLTEAEAGASDSSAYKRAVTTSIGALPVVPLECPLDLRRRMGEDVSAKVEQQECPRRELGPCLVWLGARGPDAQSGPYGRTYNAVIGKTDYVHRIVWRRCFGPIPAGLDIDHLCRVRLCQRPDHLELVEKPENTRRRHQRSG